MNVASGFALVSGCIRPSSMRLPRISRLRFDHMLRARRGVKRRQYQRSSIDFDWLSIHPVASWAALHLPTAVTANDS